MNGTHVRRSATTLLAAHLVVGAAVLLAAPDKAAGRTVRSQELGELIPNDPAVLTGALDNGLTYFVRENDEPENRAELRLVVNAGSILEDDDQLGLAHFVEHMAFNGTRNFEKQALVDYLESIGMQFGPHINAYTSFDETVYMLRVPMDDPEVMATAMRILVDWASGLTFLPEEVDKERGVVVEEWRGRRGGNARVSDEQVPVIFHESRYANRLPIGSPDVVSSAPTETLLRFYRDWYRPDLMAVVAVGDFDGAEIEGMIRESFAGLRGPENPRPREEATVPIDHDPLTIVSTDPEVAFTQVSVLFKQPPQERGTVGAFRQGLVRSLYSAMLNERIEELTLEAEPPILGGGVSRGSFVRGVDASQFSAIVPEDGIERGLDALLTKVEGAARHGFTAPELEREKASLARRWEATLAEADNRSSAALAGRYVNVFLQGGTYPTVETEVAMVEEFLPGIDLEETNTFAQDWLSEAGRVITVAGPEKEGLDTPDEEAVNAVFAAVAQKDIAPYVAEELSSELLPVVPAGSAVVSEEVIEEVGVTVWELENGVRVVLKPTDFREDQVVFSATSPGGVSLSTDEDFVSATVADQAVSSGGAGEFDRISLNRMLADKQANVAMSIGGLTEGVSGTASPQDLETAFQLIYLGFTEPRRDETAFDALKAQMAMMMNMALTPQMVMLDTLANVLAQGHPRAPSLGTMLGAMADADLDVAMDFYRERFADASDFTFYFVGSFSTAEMRPLVETYLGALPDLGREETWVDHGIDPPQGVIEKVVYKGLEPQSQTMIVFTGDGEYSRKEELTLSNLASVLDIRLRELLREDLGGTYGVSVSSSLSIRPDEEYAVNIQYGSDPERAEELSAVVFEEIERIRREGPDAETVAKVRETQRRDKETNLRRNGYWRSQLLTYESRGFDIRDIPSYGFIESWTAEEVRAAAVKYLREDQFVKVVLLPEEGEG
ncbi:MAG: insulinase family protein [Gemmatimonadetes bacterium]|nr:insulinase family protein [Gemmatimonadota bacterium]